MGGGVYVKKGWGCGRESRIERGRGGWILKGE